MKKLLVIATVFAVSAVWADDKPKTPAKKPAPAAAMPIPAPTPEMKELLALVGNWRSHETMEKVESMMMPGGEGTSTETITKGPGGLSIILSIKGVTGPMSTFRGMGVMTFDPDTKAYKMVWVENMTPGMTTESGQKQGNDIVMEGQVSMGGKTYKTRDVLSDFTPNSYTMTSYGDDGTGEKKMMTIKMKREAAKPKTEAPK